MYRIEMCETQQSQEKSTRFERMKVVRATVRHLQDGGAVLIFPSGGIDPDPAIMPGALEELETWSSSLDVILRHAPSTRILITAVSGVLHAGWVRSPIIQVRSGRRNQQRVAEFFQIIQQVLFPNSLLVNPSICFAEPFAPHARRKFTFPARHYRFCESTFYAIQRLIE